MTNCQASHNCVIITCSLPCWPLQRVSEEVNGESQLVIIGGTRSTIYLLNLYIIHLDVQFTVCFQNCIVYESDLISHMCWIVSIPTFIWDVKKGWVNKRITSENLYCIFDLDLEMKFIHFKDLYNWRLRCPQNLVTFLILPILFSTLHYLISERLLSNTLCQGISGMTDTMNMVTV